MTVMSAERVVRLPRRVPVAEVQGTLALDLQPRREPPAPLRTAPAAAEQQHDGADVVPIGRPRRPELDAWISRFGQAAVEIVGGDRPVAQLLRWTTAEVYADLERRALLVGRAGHHQPGQARVQPVRPRVVAVHTSFPLPTAVEACLRIQYGKRSRALAGRFEERSGHLVCTALEWA